MTWLFLYFLLDTSQSSASPQVMAYRAFPSEASCNAYGRSYVGIKYDDPALKSFSICVPKSAYDERGLQTRQLK